MALNIGGNTIIKGQTSVGGFNPISLFASGEQGVWYDPSDLSTMYQDSAGTTPVTALEQPVGFLIDKSKGATLGPELIVNGGFDTNTVWGLAGNWSISGGKLVGAGATNWARQDNITVAGKWYRVSFEVSSYTGGNSIRICNTSGTPLITFFIAGGAPNTYTGYFLATGTSVIIEASNATFTGTIDNFSIRELIGNHAYQSTSANRPVLSARVNLLTYSEDFTPASVITGRPWSVGINNGVISANAALAPNGSETADLLYPGSSGVYRSIYQSLSGNPNSNYTASVYAKAAGKNFLYFVDFPGSAAIAWFDLSNGSLGTVSSGYTSSITSVGNGWYLCSVRNTSIAVASYFQVGLSDADNSNTVTASGTNGIYIWGADLRLANQGINLPIYQRVGAATYGTSTAAGVADYDTTNFPYYLKFDGSNDYLVGSDANMPTGDLSIFSGSYTNTDSYGALISYGKAISGNAVALAYGPAAISYLLGASQYGSFSGISNSINKTFVFSVNRTGNNYSYRRNNGSSVSSDTMTSSTSVYGNNGLTIGSNNEAQSYNLKFNGLIYGLIIRGASSTAQQITSVENWLNQKTKAYN